MTATPDPYAGTTADPAAPLDDVALAGDQAGADTPPDAPDEAKPAEAATPGPDDPEDVAELSVGDQHRVAVRPDGSQYLVGPAVEGATYATELEDESHRLLPPVATP